MGQLILRDYQQQCIDSIPESGSYVIQMATGLGKTVTFSQIPRRGRMLILAHREELVNQPRKYFKCSYGIEQGVNKSNGEEVVGASVQSLIRRLNNFKPDDFDIIIVDECHHSSAKTYVTIINYFKPRLLLGFSGTPKRSDNVRLDNIFQKIIFERQLDWGIKNGYLCDIECKCVDVGCDLSNIHTKLGDFDAAELETAMVEDKVVDVVAETYKKHAKGQTLIFACSVNHAEKISSKITGSVVITGKTKDRDVILNEFKSKKVNCIVNCMIFTEGTDLPCIETIIMARPTKSQVLYSQSIGRGTRLHEGKEKLLLIDCVGNTGKHNLKTAASLVGIDIMEVPKKDREKIQGNIFDLPDIISTLSDTPDSWIKNIYIVNLFAKENKYEMHDVNYFKFPDGSLKVSLPQRHWVKITPIDTLGNADVILHDGRAKRNLKVQECFDLVYKLLSTEYNQSTAIWSLRAVNYWGKYDATDKQKQYIQRRLKDYDTSKLTKLEASQIINRLVNR